MDYKLLGRTGLTVSRLGLGTAEIGFAYGVGPRRLPTEEQAIGLLQLAADLGINFFDTAHFYGLAEERIGKSGIGRIPNVVISSKCGQFLEAGEDPSKQELERKIREQVEASLRNLEMDFVPILMLHGGSAEQIGRGDIIEVLTKLRESGKAKFFGISTRGEEAPIAAIKSGFFDVIQVAFSVLDQRMAENVLPLAMKENIGVINRSVFLKGALTDLVYHLPEELEPLKTNSIKAKLIALNELNCDLPALAIRFTLSELALSTVLVGTNKPENLKRSVSAIEHGPLPANIIKALKKFAISDLKQIDPFLWPRN